jgi:hypothetical protein
VEAKLASIIRVSEIITPQQVKQLLSLTRDIYDFVELQRVVPYNKLRYHWSSGTGAYPFPL